MSANFYFPSILMILLSSSIFYDYSISDWSSLLRYIMYMAER